MSALPDARYERIEVEPIAGALGAEIRGVDLARGVDDATFAEIERAFLDHLVVFFRDQDLTPARQVAFARRFGEIHHHPYVEGLPEQPEIIEIIKAEDDSYVFGGVWHSDQMFTRTPAKATMLYAREVPDVGGDTMFASMYLAHDALSDGMRAMLGALTTFNVGDGFRQFGHESRRERYLGTSSMALRMPNRKEGVTADHPILRTHPETGRKALYIGVHTQRFSNMTEDESAPTLDWLQAHSTRPEFTCRFRWRPGSVALWDNRCTQHLALDDYAGRRRVMHRITISGDAPY